MSRNELVEVPGVVATGADALPVVEYRPFEESAAFWCTLQPKNEEDQAKLFLMADGSHKPLKESVNLEIDLVHVLAHEVTFEKENGELMQATRIVLLDANGDTFQCVSVGVRDTMRRLFQIYGTPDRWKAPKRFKVALLSLGKDKQLLKLIPVVGKPKK